ncbi:hypothetical protein [Actinoplanes regularis]|uniref:hypothetical protein n=1 Tax=Actinoplanes regularis TaxID=52697 RepID=UPI00255271E9|nr:hypothetical protein [Actinoplanes regularis]GLW27778.1 hypothetical protein Areg01_07180 [Actinoplanes regularis]
MQQFAALIGAVIGAVMAFVLGSLGERARWQRDQNVRWDAARLSAYSEYCIAVKRIVHIAAGMARARGLQHSSEAVPLERGTVELAEASGERTATWETVLLLGDPETITAARAWHQAVWQLEFFARGILTGQAGWGRALDEFEESRTAFYRAARKDLGVPGEPLAAEWPPPWLERLDPEQRDAVVSAIDPRIPSGRPPKALDDDAPTQP